MSEEKEVINFPGQENSVNQESPVNVDIAGDLPQGAEEFYTHIQQATVIAFQTAAPFQNKHPALDQALNETLRYLELATMYMDRFILYVKNPHVLQKAKEMSDAPSA